MFLLLATAATILLTSFTTPVHGVPVPELENRQDAAITIHFSDPLPAVATAIPWQETWVPAAPTAIIWDDTNSTAVPTSVPVAPINSTAAPTFVPDPLANYSGQDAGSLFDREARAAKLVEERQDQPITISSNLVAVPTSVDFQPATRDIVIPDLFDVGNGTANGTTNGTANGFGDGNGDGEGICWWCWLDWW